MQQQGLSIEQSEIRYNQAKQEVFPTLTAGGGYNFILGRSQNPTNDTWDNRNNIDASLGVSSNFIVFAGFRNNHLVRQNEFNLLGSKAALEQQELETTISVTLAYLQVLFYKEALQNSDIQLQLVDLHMDQLRKMTEVGARSKLELLDFQAQKTIEIQKKVDIETQLRLSRLNLAQLVNIDSLVHVEVAKPPDFSPENLVIPDADSVYNVAVKHMPSIVCADLRVKGSEQALSVARADRYPMLSLRSAYYSRFNQSTSNSLQLDPINPTMDYPYPQSSGNDQFVILNLYLTSTIFNKKQIDSNIDQARVGLLESELSRETALQSLKKEIQQICTEALNAIEKYNAANASLAALQESFNYIKQRQLNGSASSLDFNESALKLENARVDALKSKYELLFKVKIINYFLGVPVTL
jgi:outer membrane protein